LNELLSQSPILKESDEDKDNEGNASTTAKMNGVRFCLGVPPGHLIAPGWLKKDDKGKGHDENGAVAVGTSTPTVIPLCVHIPPGILGHLTGTVGSTTSTTSTATP